MTAAGNSIRHLGPCAGLCTPDGLAELHRAHHAVLLRRARFLLEDPGLAEEAVQEVFVRAWRACAGFDPQVSPSDTGCSWFCATWPSTSRGPRRGARG